MFISATNHEESSPATCASKRDRCHQHQPGPYNARKPATPGRGEIVEDPRRPRMQINAQNCLHCKTCDIKDPTQNTTGASGEAGRSIRTCDGSADGPAATAPAAESAQRNIGEPRTAKHRLSTTVQRRLYVPIQYPGKIRSNPKFAELVGSANPLRRHPVASRAGATTPTCCWCRSRSSSPARSATAA